MGKVLDAMRRATWTRALPKSAGARLNLLMRSEKGSTKAVAERLGVSQRTVQRWLKGTHAPGDKVAKRLQEEAAKSHQPRVMARARKAAQTRGVVVETRARFGFTAAPGTSDDPRLRQITQLLPPDSAGEMWDAFERGDEQGLTDAVADGLGYAYFRDRGRRASGLGVELTDVDYMELDWGGH